LRLPLAAAALAALAVLPASAASAATLTYTAGPPCTTEAADDNSCRPGEAIYKADPGERNALTIAPDGAAFVFREEAIPIAAPAGCTQRSEREVACPSGSFPLSVTVHAGDGDDRVDVSATGGGGMTLGGGPGDDRLAGATEIFGDAANDQLTGSPQLVSTMDGQDGDDRLESGVRGAAMRGGEGNDTLTGGRGRDSLDGGTGGDVLDGGEGRDIVLYERRAEPVSVVLPRGPAGAEGEGDRLTGVEDATGGDGADRLVGDALVNVLDGGPGDDTVEGGGGGDELRGDHGLDVLRGGAGNDAIDAASAGGRALDGGREDVSCGGGRDAVVVNGDVVGRDCEGIDAGDSGPVAAPYPTRRGRQLIFRVRCPSELRRRGRCTGRLTLTQRGKTIASGPLSVGARGGRVTARFNRRPRGLVGVRLTLRRTGTSRWSVNLGGSG
jgi:Ca2+-binding RTX toxin-like protein